MVYTPVHGVGQFYAEKAFEYFKLNKFISVDEQKEPNGDFPTVKYPNPEEGKETLECSIKTAEANGADLIVANDPDADRFAVAEKDSNSGKWIVLSGNQLGTLLGETKPAGFSSSNVRSFDSRLVALVHLEKSKSQC